MQRHAAVSDATRIDVMTMTGEALRRIGDPSHREVLLEAGRTADTRDYRGIASGAYLANLRVLGADGSGDMSDVVAAIDWATEHRREAQG